MALALGFLGYALLGPTVAKKEQLQSELVRMQEENRRLVDDNRRLSLQVEALRSSEEYVEKVARDDLGFVKPDEVIFNLPGAQKSGDSP